MNDIREKEDIINIGLSIIIVSFIFFLLIPAIIMLMDSNHTVSYLESPNAFALGILFTSIVLSASELIKKFRNKQIKVRKINLQ